MYKFTTKTPDGTSCICMKHTESQCVVWYERHGSSAGLSYLNEWTDIKICHGWQQTASEIECYNWPIRIEYSRQPHHKLQKWPANCKLYLTYRPPNWYETQDTSSELPENINENENENNNIFLKKQ